MLMALVRIKGLVLGMAQAHIGISDITGCGVATATAATLATAITMPP